MVLIQIWLKVWTGVLVGSYPIKIAILGGILGFFILTISFKIIKNKITQKDMLYPVTIVWENKKANIQAILDTGNFLTDPITKVPVLVVEAQKLKDILPNTLLSNLENDSYATAIDNIEENIKTRCSFIPFSSIGKKNGLLVGFRPDYIRIETPEGEKILNKVIVGIYQYKISKSGLYSGLMGLNLLNKMEVTNEHYTVAKK